MKRIVLIIGLAFLAFIGRAQENPVNFEYAVKKLDNKVYEVRIIATIEKPWHIYSQLTPTEGPSLPTHIQFAKNPLVQVIGKPKELGKLITKHENILDVDLKYFGGKVEFIQKVKLKADIKTNISGSIDYMACTDERCLPPAKASFSLVLN